MGNLFLDGIYMDNEKIWIHYQIECYWYGIVQIHSYLDYMNTVAGIEKEQFQCIS